MKKDFGVKTWLYPMPVLMIATYNDDGTPNVMNAAWGGTGGEETLAICIDNTHKTWAKPREAQGLHGLGRYGRAGKGVRLSRLRLREQGRGQGGEERLPYDEGAACRRADD